MFEKVLEKYSAKIFHSNQVKTYALMMIDAICEGCNGSFCYTEKERKLLEAGALLHDIGYFVDKKGHHKHSLDLILNLSEEEKEGFSDEEIKIIAHIARYHRSSFPDESKHKRFAALNESSKETVLKLSSLLRIADGLDNPHKNLITGMEFEETPETFNLYIRTVGFAPKLNRAQEKKDLFESVFKKPLNIICKKN